jgi:hypothetical protein
MPRHPAAALLHRAITLALTEMQASNRYVSVQVFEPSSEELPVAAEWLRRNPDHPDWPPRHIQPVLPAQAPGWLAPWTVEITGDFGGSTKELWPGYPATDLLVDVADWLQDLLMDVGQSTPLPSCPGHSHPQRPIVHRGEAWWACPVSGPHHRWAQSLTAQPQ